MERVPFDKEIDAELLDNDFAFFSDWEYGPLSTWSGQNIFTLRLMRHDYGYWLIVVQNASGEHILMNVGSSNSAKEIIAVRDALKQLW